MPTENAPEDQLIDAGECGMSIYLGKYCSILVQCFQDMHKIGAKFAPLRHLA
jgi:hypothetical protein